MRKAIFGIVLVGVLLLLGILGWWFIYTRQIQSELENYEHEVASKKKINVEFVVTPPANTPKDQFLYLSGSVPALGNWEAAGVQLRPAADGKMHASVPDLLSGQDYTFKITRG